MRTVHSYALTQLQLWWPELTRGLIGMSGWEYIMIASYVMECAKRGFISVGTGRRLEILGLLRQQYPGVMFEHRHDKFQQIYDSLDGTRMACIIGKLREEMVSITGEQNLVWANLQYSPIDIVKCRYRINLSNRVRAAL